jgi:hypothetical protein
LTRFFGSQKSASFFRFFPKHDSSFFFFFLEDSSIIDHNFKYTDYNFSLKLYFNKFVQFVEFCNRNQYRFVNPKGCLLTHNEHNTSS